MPATPLAPKTLKRISTYAGTAGKTLEEAIDHAVNEWMDDIGDPTIAYILRKQREKIEQKSQGKSRSGAGNALIVPFPATA